ncbi:DNA-processing protein DprA [Candidatus Raskinella chloraquaticus]|uniref:DNA processing protein DprA n=1 Tax=Candidatus Raskinella chloraquaticus TaxID=1951219 RepID=A0A1W9I4T5_9HYPH|nr:MAG: DNA processing protein DprA [Proteobacteria bacterium SG_bin8]
MNRRSLSDSERRDWLRLSRTEQVGPVTFQRLLERFGSAAAAIEALPTLARRGGRAGGLKLPSLAVIEDEMAAHHKTGARLIAWCEPDYPAPLAATEDAPPLIAVVGHTHLLHKPSLGIVGARSASLNGKRMAERLAAQLGEAGLVITSGLARGIDAAAHRGALKTGTVGVVAGGVDVIYPQENRELYAALREQGAIVSEMPPGTEPQARHFPRRNRIISGLSQGVLVIEAAFNSGSLITARLAAEQGREVFAVPGSPAEPRCRGSNNLLRDGATMVEEAADVLKLLATLRPLSEPPAPPMTGAPLSLTEDQLAEARAILLENLDGTPTAVDDLIRECQLSPAAVQLILLELELAGRLERHSGNRVSLVLL